jgi:diguanylate cyclase (GGDEF)-like protein
VKAITNKRRESKDLGSVVRRSFLKTALLPIMTVEVVLLSLYLLSNHYIVDKNLELLRNNALETISDISITEARNIDDQLREISRNNRSLQVEHQALFSHSLTKKLPFLASETSEDFGEIHKFGHSSVFVSSNTDLGPEISEKIVKTEKMEVRFGTLVDSNPNLISSHFISWDNVVRTYPFVEDFYDKHPYDFDLTKSKNYYLADEKRNPSRESVWTAPYLDPSGKGWMLSNLVPVYKNDFLEGVNVLTVTLNTFSKHILSKDLQWSSGGIVMDQHGNILTMSRSAEKFLGLSDVTNYNLKDKSENQAVTRPTKFNLLKQNTMTGMYFSEFFNGNEESIEFKLQDQEYLVTKRVIPETGWQLFILTPLNNVYAPIKIEEAKIDRLCMIFLGLALVFYIIFFIRLRLSAKKLAKRITKPIEQVTHMITAYESDDATHKIHEPVHITELDNLLSMNFKIQKAKVRYQKLSKEMIVKNKQLKTLSITDQLTQLYNRLKLDEVLSYEVARSKRDRTPLTVAIIDIDKFKLVNDTFGHQMGDSVLIGVAQVMRRNIRSTDVLGRWGGEEFMLLMPNTPLEHAYEHVDQLRKLISGCSFSPVKQVTISIGIASCAEFDCEKKLVEQADNALYEAKTNGRNRVEMAPMVATKPEKSVAVSVAV